MYRRSLIRFALAVGLLCLSFRTESSGAEPLQLHLPSGEQIAVKLLGYANDALLIRNGEQEEHRPLAHIQRLGDWQELSRGPHILLIDGSILVADVLRMTTDELHLGDAAGLERCRWHDVRLPLSLVRGIVFQPPANPLQRDQLALAIEQTKRREDELGIVTGDVVKGIALGTQPKSADATRSWESLRFQIRGVNRGAELPAERVRWLALNTALEDKPSPARGWLGIDGNRLAFRQLTADSKIVRVELACGLKLTADLITEDELAPRFWNAVTFLWPGETATTLVIPTPTKHEFRPYLKTEWSWGNGTNVLGGRLRTQQSIACSGWGTHAGGTLECDVPSGSNSFVVEAGVDAAAKNCHGVIFAIHTSTDGLRWKEAAVSPLLKERDPPFLFRVSVRESKKIKLETRWTDQGDVQTYGNWNYPRFVRGEKTPP